MVAILRQESNFNNNAKNCRNNICHDFGIAQINKHTAKAYNFDLKKIMKDPIYSIDCMGRVLHDLKKQYAKKDKLWWTYYNAVTWEKRLNYYLAVNRYK